MFPRSPHETTAIVIVTVFTAAALFNAGFAFATFLALAVGAALAAAA